MLNWKRIIFTVCDIYKVLIKPDSFPGYVTNTAFMVKKTLLIIILGTMLLPYAMAQKNKAVLKDTLDGKFDMSNWVINLHGFVPYPTVISEPALGNFGVALAAVFISPKKTAKQGEQFHFPDITGVAGMWTLNNTWGVGALRQGTFPAIGMRYTIGLGYADANMDYYRTFKNLGEKEFSFKLKPLFALLDISENLYRNKIFAGLRYTFIYMKSQYKFTNPFLDSLSKVAFDQSKFDEHIGTFGIYCEVDTRNTIFTPDRGIRFKPAYTFGRNWTGSQIDTDQLEGELTVFLQPVKPWVCGFRLYGVGLFNNVPFYYYPYIDMRGIPMMHYQGQQVFQIETEQRFDITRRWSLLGFVGTGRTWSDSKNLSDESWHWAGGTGFRYLIARIFKLRMGIDIAAGPGQFSYYIVFGHYWN